MVPRKGREAAMVVVREERGGRVLLEGRDQSLRETLLVMVCEETEGERSRTGTLSDCLVCFLPCKLYSRRVCPARRERMSSVY